MTKIKIIDVTLRDGGYKNNFDFSSTFVETFLGKMDQSGVDYIEVGYRNGPLQPTTGIGISGLCAKDYLNFCRKLLHSAKLTVILHPKNVSEDDFKEMKDCGVDALRICISRLDPTSGSDTIALAKKYNFEFCTNLTRVTEYSYPDLQKAILKLAAYQPLAIYLADSNGSLTPSKVSEIYPKLIAATNTPLGFHAHDNLFLAQSNAIAAIQNGATFIDSSICGLGKGAGNLRTEGIVSYLLLAGVTGYDFCSILEMAEILKAYIKQHEVNLSVKDTITGLFDLNVIEAARLGDYENSRGYFAKAQEQLKQKIII